MKNTRVIERLAAAAMFFAAAAITRAILTETESRGQMLGFAALAAAYELISRPALGITPRLSGFAINAGVAIIAVLAIRWQLEGLCPGVKQVRCFP